MTVCTLQHNVCGRSIYAEGTVDAALFIASRALENATQTVYAMDAVAGGAFQRQDSKATEAEP